ncbi:MAG: DUF58 domain-containing protein [bacterium]
MIEKTRYLSPDILEKISRMELRARTVVEGLLTGLHRSRGRGFNVEFLEHREYTPGDDLRHVDWKLYAKSDRYFVKQHEEETSLQARILLDSSASMRFGSNAAGETKLDYASVLAVAIAYLFLKQGDAVGFLSFDSSPIVTIEPRNAREHLYRILAAIEGGTGGGETAVARSLENLASQLKRRSFVVLISDLLEETAPVTRTLMLMKRSGHDVAVFHVMDEAELTFPYSRSSRFTDMETRRAMTVEPAAVRRQYIRNLRKFIGGYTDFCRQAGIDFSATSTSTPVEKTLMEFLSRRELRKRR